MASFNHITTALLRRALLAGAAAAVMGGLAGCSKAIPGIAPPAPTAGAATPAAPAPKPSAAPVVAQPSAAAVAVQPAAPRACAGADLDATFASQGAAAGGQNGVDILVADRAATACLLTGPFSYGLRDTSGAQLPTTAHAAAGGPVVLSANRAALDARNPQPGEALIQVTWRTGDVQPGVCAAAAPAATSLQIGVGGSSLSARIANPSSPAAPCGGVVEVGAPQGVTLGPGATSARQAGIDAARAATGDNYEPSGTCPQSTNCLIDGTATLGDHAAYVTFADGSGMFGMACVAYLFQDSAGWHPLDVACTQASGAPMTGGTTSVLGAAGSTSALRAHAGDGAAVVGSIAAGTDVTVDSKPFYRSSVDPVTGLTSGDIWWHVQAGGASGWMAHDDLAIPAFV